MRTDPAADNQGDGAPVALSLPADAAYVSVARAAAAALASTLDWTLDDLDDLRIGVDEASAMLLQPGTADTLRLECTRDGDHGLVVSLTAETGGEPVSTEVFGWTVLRAVSDDARASTDGATTSITLRKSGHLEHR